jgi:hypothetical protein
MVEIHIFKPGFQLHIYHHLGMKIKKKMQAPQHLFFLASLQCKLAKMPALAMFVCPSIHLPALIN